MSRAVKQEPMCSVRIAHTELLMPADKGMKLLALLQNAVECERRYGERDWTFTIYNEPLEVEFKLVQASQIRAPKQPSKPAPSGPLLLEG